MSPDKTLSFNQTIPLLSNLAPSLYHQGATETSAPIIATVPAKDMTTSPVDTVSISPLLQQTLAEIKQEALKKEQVNNAENNNKPDGAIAKVQFFYNQSGDVGIKYLDSARRLVYQTPSVLMMQLKESLSNPDTSVDTKA